MTMMDERGTLLFHACVRAQIITFCREENERGDKCGEPAEFILWGKLIAPEGLGPRCYDHAAKHVGHSALGDPAWAICDLRPVLRLAA